LASGRPDRPEPLLLDRLPLDRLPLDRLLLDRLLPLLVLSVLGPRLDDPDSRSFQLPGLAGGRPVLPRVPVRDPDPAADSVRGRSPW
jgi:hypothetical protein